MPALDKDANLLEQKIREKLEVASGFATKAKQAEVLNKQFKKMDSNGNGSLTCDEFGSALKMMNFVLEKEVVAALFKRWDASGDGVLSIDEFSSGLVNNAKPKCKATKGVPQVAQSSATLNPMQYKEKFKTQYDQMLADVGDPDKLKLLWKALDFNGNGGSTLAEIDKFVNDRYPVLNNKPALMRAYKRTCSKKGGGDGDDYVEKKEFKTLMKNLFFFNQIFQIFDEIDSGDDRRIDGTEFLKAAKFLDFGGKVPTQEELVVEFNRVDKNGGGQVLFDEFCAWYLDKQGM